jgi:hypothetical protein
MEKCSDMANRLEECQPVGSFGETNRSDASQVRLSTAGSEQGSGHEYERTNTLAHEALLGDG